MVLPPALHEEVPAMLSKHVAFLALLWFGLVPGIARAVCPDPPAQSRLAMGEVGLFFDAEATVTCSELAVGVPTTLYVVARVPADGIQSYDIPWLMAMQLPPGLIFITTTTDLPAGSAFSMFPAADTCDQAFPIDPDTCPTTPGELLVLGTTTLTPVSTVTGTARFATACPTFAGLQAVDVSYTNCASSGLLMLHGGDAMFLGFGEAPISAGETTWSTVKARFGHGD
jgi:hypothetical protein